MVKLCIVLVMVAAVLPQSVFSKKLSCRMEPNRSCSLIDIKLYADEVMHTEFVSPNPSTLTKVQFERSTLAAISPAMFQTFPKLDTVNASNSEIKRVYSNTFADARSLLSLYLRGNKINELPAEAFFGANRLEVLDVSHNGISTIHSTAFKRLRNLKTLKLNENSITQLDSNVFDDLSEMENLELQQNDLSTIGDLVFSGCPSLTTLNVSHNALKTFSMAQFERRYNFDLIDVSHNHLELVNIPASLRQLVATGNGIRTVESNAINGSALILLKMPQNKMTSVDEIPPFDKLITLDLSYNKIYEFDFSSIIRFPKLLLLKLDGNQLESVSNSLEKPLTHLKYVHLADNRFVHLDLNVMQAVPRVLKLDLRRNQLERITVTDLSDSFPVMVRLMLEGNRFRCEDNKQLIRELKGSITAYAMTRKDCRKNENLIEGICCS
ncbi:leucine-rich repeats and immunoglobulin-like domains protein 2 [Anopheles maculipalpis]|uniref:leucine-rich repeats and immunoglobulin-like domains protein 2 n=1 Tax=Anopheles maculipalpis TaxID=1496333 RepID=UPI0021593363|nr:leucine-rich repeats and immunoglobulin-like domains protein 2 [Anopheles maculipalpis]